MKDQKCHLPLHISTLVPEIFKFEKWVKYANEKTDDVIHHTYYTNTYILYQGSDGRIPQPSHYMCRCALKNEVYNNRCYSYVPVNSKIAHPPPPPPPWANSGAFDFFEKFWSNSLLCCCFDGQMPHPLELQRGSNPPPCHAMQS